jgi:hypothetical protein
VLASLGEPIDSGGPLSYGQGNLSELSRGPGEEFIGAVRDFGGREAKGGAGGRGRIREMRCYLFKNRHSGTHGRQ